MKTIITFLCVVGTAYAQDPSDAIYDENAVNTIRITIDPGAWNAICNDGAGQGGGGVTTIWHRADFQWQNETVSGVGVRRSGEGTASMQQDKPSIRISFNEFEFANPPGPNTPGRKWRGVNRIKLDSMIGNTDPAMMRDRVAYWIFRDLGAPASRACSGRLTVNGDFKGLYTVEEPIRKDWLRYRWNEEGGNLYNSRPKAASGLGNYRWRGGNPASYVPDPWEEENNPGGDYSDLVELMNIINNFPADQIRARLDGHINLDGFLRHLAMVVAIADGDDIVAWWGIGIEGVNNHYWYHRQSTNRMEILKWDPGASQGLYDQDSGFGKGQSPIWHGFDNTQMTSWVRNDATANAAFKSKLLQVVNGPFAQVHGRIDWIYAQIRDHVYQDPYKPQSNAEFDAARDWLKDWYTRRAAYLRSQLGVNNSAFVSQTVPTSMTAGQTTTVSVRMRNTGTLTWTSGNYTLGSQNPVDNTTWGMNRVQLPAGSSIGNNQEVTFTWVVTAPAAAGTYNFQWQMRQSGVEWFGPLTPNIAVTVTTTPGPPPPPPPTATNGAQYVSQSVPATMVAGQNYSVTVRMRNTGTSAWTDAETHHLRSQNPPKNFTWGVDRASLAAGETIAPNQEKVFAWTVTAPATPGTYNFQWQMRQSTLDQWFGDLTANVAVTVTTTAPPPPPPPPPAGTNAAQFVAQVAPATMTAGQTYTVSVTFRNSGTTTWTEAGQYRLSSRGPRDNTTWGINRVYLAPGDAIAPGQSHTFTFDVDAPATAGSYTFQWSMVQDGVDWFAEVSPALTITVTAAAAPPPAPAVAAAKNNSNGDSGINDKCAGSTGSSGSWAGLWLAVAAFLLGVAGRRHTQ